MQPTSKELHKTYEKGGGKECQQTERSSMVRRVNDLIFYFKNESVIMCYHNQYVCFHSYNVRNKNLLKSFTTSLKRRRNIDLNYVYNLAGQYEVPSFSISRDSVEVIRRKLEREQ